MRKSNLIPALIATALVYTSFASAQVPADSGATAATGQSGSQEFENVSQKLSQAMWAEDFPRIIELAKAAEAFATTPDDKVSMKTIREQAEVELQAKTAVQNGQYDAAISIYKAFSKRWPEQADPVIEHIDQLEKFQFSVPPAVLKSGTAIAKRVLELLPNAKAKVPLMATPAGTEISLQFRQMMRPLVGLDLRALDNPKPEDLERFLQFIQTLKEADAGRKFAILMGSTYSQDDAGVPGTGYPNSLLAFEMLKFTDLDTQNAFGLHDLSE
jgi:hypothetical protein